MTAKEAAALTGRSITWLRTHQCGLCEQSALNAIRWGGKGCGAIFGREGCKFENRLKAIRAKSALTHRKGGA